LARPPSSIELSASEMAKGVAVPAAAVAQRRSARERGVAPCAAVLVRDRDRIFGQDFVKHVRAMGIKQVLSAPHSPWQRTYVERVIGTIRRQCLDHLIVFQERSLYRHLRTFVGHYHRNCVHLALEKDTPEPRPIQPPESGRIVSIPVLGRLHHRYERSLSNLLSMVPEQVAGPSAQPLFAVTES
jgi:hypothetical protein